MLYDLSNPFSRNKAITRMKFLLDRNALVDLTEKTMRTPSQNRYLHLIIGVLAMETGNTLEYAKEWYFKRTANKELFVKTVEDQFAGEIEVVRSSRDLTKEQMSIAIDRFKKWAAEHGIYLPNPEDLALLKDIEIEMSKCQQFL